MTYDLLACQAINRKSPFPFSELSVIKKNSGIYTFENTVLMLSAALYERSSENLGTNIYLKDQLENYVNQFKRDPIHDENLDLETIWPVGSHIEQLIHSQDSLRILSIKVCSKTHSLIKNNYSLFLLFSTRPNEIPSFCLEPQRATL